MDTLLNQLAHQMTDPQEEGNKVKWLRLIAQVLVVVVLSVGALLGVTLYQHQALMKPLSLDAPSDLKSRRHHQRAYKTRWGRFFPQLTRAQDQHYQAQLLTLFDQRVHLLLSQLNERPVLPPLHWIGSKSILREIDDLIELIEHQHRDDHGSTRSATSTSAGHIAVSEPIRRVNTSAQAALQSRGLHLAELKSLMTRLQSWASGVQQRERSLSGATSKQVALNLLKESLQNLSSPPPKSPALSSSTPHSGVGINPQGSRLGRDHHLALLYSHALSRYQFDWHRRWFHEAITEPDHQETRSSHPSGPVELSLGALIEIYHLISERSLDLFGVVSLKLQREIERRWSLEWRHHERLASDATEASDTLDQLLRFARKVNDTQRGATLAQSLSTPERSLIPTVVMRSWRACFDQLRLRDLSEVVAEQATREVSVSSRQGDPDHQEDVSAMVSSTWFGPLLSSERRASLEVLLETKRIRSDVIAILMLRRASERQLTRLRRALMRMKGLSQVTKRIAIELDHLIEPRWRSFIGQVTCRETSPELGKWSDVILDKLDPFVMLKSSDDQASLRDRVGRLKWGINQERPLFVQVWDHDRISTHDLLSQVSFPSPYVLITGQFQESNGCRWEVRLTHHERLEAWLTTGTLNFAALRQP